MQKGSRVIEALCCLANARVAAHVEVVGGDPSATIWDAPQNDWVRQALCIAESIAHRDARDPQGASEGPFRSEPLLDEIYWAYRVRAQELAGRTDQYPANPAGHVLFCPRGCAQLYTTDGCAECDTCGALMLPDHKEAHYGSLAAAGIFL